MKIFLNGVELARAAEGDLTVDRVLSELREEIRHGGKVITQIALDGKPLPNGWQRRQKLNSGVAMIERMDLTIDEPDQIRMNTIDNAAALVDRLAKQAKPLGRKFRVGDEVSANNELAAFLEDLKLILSGLDLTTRAMNPNTQWESARQQVVDRANKLLPTLDRIYKAQARGDYIAVADEVEYDLREQISDWKGVMSDVRQVINPLAQA